MFVGYVYDVMALEGNEEEIEYWLDWCVKIKYKLTHTWHDDDGFEYPTGSMVVVNTWLWKLFSRRNDLGTYKYYETHKKFIHYLYLILETNIKLSKYKGRPTNKVLWNISI